jgi:hypothetical protein
MRERRRAPGGCVKRCEKRENICFNNYNKALGNTVATQGFRKNIGKLMWVVFVIFFLDFSYI